MAAGLRLLQRHNKEILEELTLVQVLFSGAAGAAVVSLARLAQDGLDCGEALTMRFRRRRRDTFYLRTVKTVAKKTIVCLSTFCPFLNLTLRVTVLICYCGQKASLSGPNPTF